MKKQYYLGLDVGGTKVEGAIATLDGNERTIEVFAKKRIAVNSSDGADGFVLSLHQLICDLLSLANLTLSDLAAIGMGLPGSLDPKTKIMMNGNTRFLIGFDLIASLKNKLNCNLPIFAQNDANLFVLAEAWGGAGLIFNRQKHIPFEEQVAVGITLGTGVGGGLLAAGQIYNGAHGSGLEVGHVSLNPSGNSCYCGQQGCAETYLSGTALNRIADSKEIFSRALASETGALVILEDYRRHLVHLLSILNNLFNPHYFVFGGGLSSQSIIFNGLKADLEDKIFLSKEFCPEIYINQLGDSAGLFGAMIYAQELLG